MAKTTGHKWRVKFVTSEFAFDFINVTPNPMERPEVDMTDLDDDTVDAQPGDVVDAGSLVFTAYQDPDKDWDDVIRKDPETIEVLFGPDEAGTKKWSFTGWVSNVTPQEATHNQRATVQVTVRANTKITKGEVPS